MAQWVRANTALTGDLLFNSFLVPVTPAPGNLLTFSGPSAPVFICACTQTHTHNTQRNRKTKIFLTSYKFHVDYLSGPRVYCVSRNVIFPTHEYRVCFHLFFFSSNVSFWISKDAYVILLFIILMHTF